MAHCHVRPDGHRRPDIRVDHRQVLDVRVLADGDRIIVAAQHTAIPDRGIFTEKHIAHHLGAAGDPEISARRQGRGHSIQFINSHFLGVLVRYLFRKRNVA